MQILFENRHKGTYAIQAALQAAGYTRTLSAIRGYSKRYKIDVKVVRVKKAWQPKEIEIMQAFYAKVGSYETAKELKRNGFNRTTSQVIDKAHHLGIKIPMENFVNIVKKYQKPIKEESKQNLHFSKRKMCEFAITTKCGAEYIKVGGKWIRYWKYIYEMKTGEKVTQGHCIVPANPDYPLAVWNMKRVQRGRPITENGANHDRSAASKKNWANRRRKQIQAAGGIVEALNKGYKVAK